MNIANVFGLHLGCKVKFNTGEVAILSGVDSYHIHINNTLLNYTIKDCKLLLKPLINISVEDKVEFFEKFYPDEEDILEINAGVFCVSIVFVSGHVCNTNVEETLWLASRGFDIGIVPPEYMEIVE